MSTKTGIGWTDHTFNPWWGCVEVSPGCDNCYARVWAKRMGHDVWGADAPRKPASESYWREPLAWNRAAARVGVRRRVFCASMADVFEKHPTADEIRPRLWELIRATPNLDWLLLTKRPHRIAKCLPEDWSPIGGYSNVWLGTSAENQRLLDLRVPRLLDVPAAVRFVSCEPLLGPLNLRARSRADACIRCGEGPEGRHDHPDGYRLRGLDWIIVGGESGPDGVRRNMEIAWLASVVDQCRAVGVPVYVKQDSARRDSQRGRIPDDYWTHEWPESGIDSLIFHSSAAL
jgi:protein gp37